MPRGAVIALSHGGGPLPLLGDPEHIAIVRSFASRVPKILKLGTPEAPRAIVLVTAHWSETNPTISNGAKHKLYYDYSGFPPETYKIKYDAPGDPAVAKEVFDLMAAQGLKPKMDPQRGNELCKS
jgi:aromatic ring-opening dioxygenase catalytic subunit (LigB family)